MFGGEAVKNGRVEMFNKYSISGKTVVITKKAGRTEDMKLNPVDFDEMQNESATFEESSSGQSFRIRSTSTLSSRSRTTTRLLRKTDSSISNAASSTTPSLRGRRVRSGTR